MGSPEAPRPEEIADPRLYADEPRLQRLFSALRAHDPLAHVEPVGFRPFRIVSRHADVREVERQPELFHAGPRSILMPIAQEQANLAMFGEEAGVRALVMLDGAYHKKMRALTSDYFLPRNVVKLQAMIEATAASFVEDMLARDGRCDFAADVAFWFPLRVIMTMMGIPPQDEAVLLRLTQELFGHSDVEFAREGETGPEHVIGVIQDYGRFFEAITADRRANPRDDLSTIIANGRIDGEELPLLDRLSYYMILATAGHDTTSASIAGGLLALIERPELVRRMRDDQALFANFTNEAIRWTAPVKHFMRTVQAPCAVGGCELQPGEALLLSYASACRDEAEFADADSFSLDRANVAHLAFGIGVHQCLGQFIAKMEIEAFHRAFWDRVESVELDGAPEYVASSFVSGLKRLPIRFRAK